MSGIDNLRGGNNKNNGWVETIQWSEAINICIENFRWSIDTIKGCADNRIFILEDWIFVSIDEWCKWFCKKKTGPFICSKRFKCWNFQSADESRIDPASNQNSYFQWLNDWEITDWM